MGEEGYGARKADVLLKSKEADYCGPLTEQFKGIARGRIGAEQLTIWFSEGELMLDKFTATNHVDDKGNPTGGSVSGTGMSISWQDGPLGRGEDRKGANGAFVETVIAGAKQRIEFYQTASGGRFNCAENALAIQFLESALEVLNKRTLDREKRQVEGTHTA